MTCSKKRRSRRHLAAFGAAFGLLLTGLCARPGHAWSGGGHMAIALVAYRSLTPQTRDKVDNLLKAHPDYAKWVSEVPAGTPEAARGSYIFAIAATWPDRIKSQNDDSVTVKFYDLGDRRRPVPNPLPTDPRYPDLAMHKDWHYVDFPVNADGKGRGAPTEDSALIELPLCRSRLGQANLPASQRAYYLAWVEHLVGDVHQPLHCTTRYSSAYPNGDQGGNLVHLDHTSRAEPANLHSYWDGLLGYSQQWAEVTKTADGLQKDAPRLLAGYDPATCDSTDVALWCRESFDLDQNLVYTMGPDGVDPIAQPDAAYHDRALAAARVRGALAGRRLARLLEETLGGPSAGG